MSTLEQEFNNQIRDISNEGIRLKKFRQSVIQNFLGERLESDLKKEFASILENFTADGRVILDGGMVMKGKVFVPAANVSKKRKTMSDDLKLDELEQLTPMQIAVTEALNELTEEVRLKKFRKAVFSRFQNIDEEQLKSDFASTFEEFCSRGDAKETDGMVRRLCDVKVIRKPKKVLERVDVSEARKELWKYGEQTWADGTLDQDYLAENPDGITRLFCGNLKKTITEDDLHNAINGITHIKWMTDKVTREFYGSTFIEMKDPRAAAAAVMLDKTKLLGRPLKIYYCPPRPGDVWPPVGGGGGPNAAGNAPPRAAKNIRPKPPGCRKLFCGNLAYEIDDEVICNFFKDCGHLTGLRWLTREGTGEFRGCAFVEFATSEEADNGILKNGEMLLSRPIRLDWDG